jgi:hypothetical protein
VSRDKTVIFFRKREPPFEPAIHWMLTATEVTVTLRLPPDIFLENPLPPNYVRFRLTPELVIAIGSHVKLAGERLLGEQVELVVSGSSDPQEMQAMKSCWETL